MSRIVMAREVDLHLGGWGYVIGNKTLRIDQNIYDEFSGRLKDVNIELPSCPKWMLDQHGKRVRFQKGKRVLIPTSEIAVKLPGLNFDNIDDRERAFEAINRKGEKRDLAMKCKWIYIIYRQRATVLNAFKGGCVAYMEYGVIGG